MEIINHWIAVFGGCWDTVWTVMTPNNSKRYCHNTQTEHIPPRGIVLPTPALYGSIVTSALLLSPPLCFHLPIPLFLPHRSFSRCLHRRFAPDSQLWLSFSSGTCIHSPPRSLARNPGFIAKRKATALSFANSSPTASVFHRAPRPYLTTCFPGPFVAVVPPCLPASSANSVLPAFSESSERRPFQSILDFLDLRCIGCAIDSAANLDCASYW